MGIRLVQLETTLDAAPVRRVAVVDEPLLHVLKDFESVFDLISAALSAGIRLRDLIDAKRGPVRLNYDEIHAGKSDWRLLPPIDHLEPSRLVISGTGLTHLGSAKNRDAMHETQIENPKSKIENDLTDSMKIFRWGLERGRPAPGEIGVAPEWFYKGTGTTLRAHNQPLEVPAFAEDGGEEAEIAGIYIIEPAGNPVRIGMAQGNEFSDHIFEKKNYLNLAGSKLRTSSLGPELVIDPDFSSVPGRVQILRQDSAGRQNAIWSKSIATGESEMCHSLANIEHHHFKFANHRRPGDIHVHFYGACALSFGEDIRLQNGDTMEIHFEGFGRPLRNPVHMAGPPQKPITVRPIT